jgi:hypothetical protein
MAYEKPLLCATAALAAFLVLRANCLAQESQSQPQEDQQNQPQESRRRKPPEPLQDHSCTVDAAGIFATPVGQDRQNFNHGGWGFQAGGGFEVTPQAEPGHGTWFITANYLYDKFRARSDAVAKAISQEPTQLAGTKSAHGAFSAVTLDPTVRIGLPRRDSFYIVGGFGWLHRGIGFNGANTGPMLLPSSSSLDRVASNSGVFDFGVGLNFAPRGFRGVMVFTEGRIYHGTAINSGSSLVPFSVGVRW